MAGGIEYGYQGMKADPSAKLSPRCEICGDVTIGEDSSVFSGAQIRGDVSPVSIGSETNIQENCILHEGIGAPLVIGDRVTVGHGAILHGCTIGDDVLVGMGSIVLDGARIGPQSVIGAGALVTGGKEFPPRSMIIGSPAKLVRELSDKDVERLIGDSAAEYVEVADRMVEQGMMLHPSAGDGIWPRS